MEGAVSDPIVIPITFLKVLLPNLKLQLPRNFILAFLNEDFVNVT